MRRRAWFSRAPPSSAGSTRNFRIFPGDHVALFLVRAWEQPSIPPANAEIAEQGFFHWQDVPGDVRIRERGGRLAEVFGGAAQAASW